MNKITQFRSGLALLAVGVALAAASAAQLGASDLAQTVASGQTALAGAPAASGGIPGPVTRLQEWANDHGLVFLVGLILVIAGVVFARRASRPDPGAQTSTAGASAGQLTALLEGVRALAKNLDQANEADIPGLQQQLEQLQLQHVEPFVAARDNLNQRLGLSAYAGILGTFSAGERLLNRCWSALVDGHLPEARSSVERATLEFEQAISLLAAAEHKAAA